MAHFAWVLGTPLGIQQRVLVSAIHHLPYDDLGHLASTLLKRAMFTIDFYLI